MVREITNSDFDGLMKLYMQLHNNKMVEKNEEVIELWNKILEDKNHHIIIAEEEGEIISSCVCVIVPNLTRGQRSYALVENVITDERYRNRGFATKCLNYAQEIAEKENCYKIMLMTGSKEESTLHFYEKAGYKRNEKIAFIKWIM
ncbi:MAG: GNAT family N-acetyltransferase [Clostridium sp.]